MDKRRQIFISVLVGILSFVGILSYVKNKERHLLQLSEMTTVLVATRDIMANSQIDETMLRKFKVPKKFLQPKAFSDFRDVVGRVAEVPIFKDEQILGSKLLQFGSETGLAMKIPIGYRAVSIAVNLVTGVSQLILPNDSIDLLATFDFGDQAQSKKYTYTLFENVQVLAVQKDMGHGFQIPQQNQTEKNLVEKVLNVDRPGSESLTLTLALTPEDAQKLVLAQETGTLSLTLRPRFGTENKLKLDPVTPAQLTGLDSLIKQTAKPVYMEYKGGKR